LLSRFYSTRTQTTGREGEAVEDHITLNTLADPFALGYEKMEYLK